MALKAIENSQIAAIFEEIADLLELQDGDQFRVRSYRNAARSVGDTSQSIKEMAENGDDVTSLPNVGKSTAAKILEILKTGTCQRLEELREKTPTSLTELMQVAQLGPQKVKLIHEQLGVSTISELEEAANKHQLRELSGLGAKTEENILQGIERLKSTSGRVLLKEATDAVDGLADHLSQIDEIKRWDVAGSFRRQKETIGDLDILIDCEDRKACTDAILEYKGIDNVMSRGTEKSSVRLKAGLQVDFRFIDSESYGAALLYFSGSKEHSVVLRKRAQEKKWKLNEYGLFSGKRRLAAKTENAIYTKLGLAWIPPELREDRGEIDAAEADQIPRLIGYDDIRGDLHCHTTASDGKDSIEDMVAAAKDRGYEYLAITDHSKAVRIANGLSEDRLRRHADAIREVNSKQKKFWALAGVEVDILKNGKLDFSDEILADLDWVVASIHSHLNLSREDMTARMVAAIESGVVHCIGHPFARMFGKRDPIPLDFDRVLEACRDHNVSLEVSGQPERLDLPDVYARTAAEHGVPLVVSTDAHRIDNLDYMKYGIAQARRGWVQKKHVWNTVSASTLKKRIAR